MAEALLGLAPSSYDDAPSNKFSITRPDDLPAQLRRTLETKKTASRCEHISVTLDFPSTVEFVIHEGDGDALDPALGGFRTEVADGQTLRIVRAYELIINQPQDNPAMQQAVAMQIVSLLSTVDESTWVVREVSRGHYGWTFTYGCKDSFAMWNRQNGKSVARSLIGDYSQKELDPVTLSRPAFDCRGSLTIAFSKNSRVISVKYEHTPFHKTVGEMIEHFRPLPPAPPPAPLIPASDKPKKTPRKRKSEVNPDGTPSQPKKKRKKTSEAKADAPEVPTDDAGPASADDGQTVTTVPTKADTAVQSGVHSKALLNVPPAEAARRREVAIRILSDSGVPPESLSSEQFSIFANQSPDLQKESLSMLIKYGAERLRIVHPSETAASSPSTSVASQQAQTTQQATAEPDANAVAEASDTPTTEKKKRPRKSRDAAGAEDEELVPAPAGTPIRRISRGSCISCRTSRAKCDRGKPICNVCQEQGLNCQYPLAKVRVPKKTGEKSAAQVEDDDDAEAEAEPEPEPVSEPEVEQPETEPEPVSPPEHEVEGEPEPDDIETIDYTSNMPVSNMLTPAIEATNQDYFNSGPNGVTSAQTASNDLDAVSSYPEPAATITYAEQHATTTSYAQPSLIETASYAQPGAATNYHQPVTTDTSSYTQPTVKSPRASQTYAASESRHGLPLGQPQQSAAESLEPLPSYAQNWQTTLPPKATTNSVSPTLTNNQPQMQKPAQAPAAVVAASQQNPYGNTQQYEARAVVQQQQQQQQQSQQQQNHQPSPKTLVAQTASPAQVSPFQSPVQTASAKSRSGHRASNRTPVNEQRATPSHHTVQPTTQTTVDTATYHDAHPLSNISSYNTYKTKPNTGGSPEGTRVAYEPYVAQTTTATTSTYPLYDSYERNQAAAQTASIAYTPSSNPRSGQWSNTPTRHTQSYNSNTATPPEASYSQTHSTTQQKPATLQSFNMRAPEASNQTRSSPSSSTKYNQQQPQLTQPYGSYSSQAQQQSNQSDQEHGWYGGFGSNANTFAHGNSAGGYAARSNAPAGYGNSNANANANANQSYQQQQQQQQQQQHHGSLNVSGHSYTGGDNEFYDLLKNSINGPGR